MLGCDMVLIPVVYFSIFTFGMAVYCDKQILECESENRVIGEFMVVLVANIVASWYMVYSIMF